MQRPYVLTNFMGEDAAYAARKVCNLGGIPTYRTPEGAVGAFMHLVQYRRNQKHLTQTPESLPQSYSVDNRSAKKMIKQHLLDEQSYLSTYQTRPILQHYGIDIIQTEVALTPSEAKE